MQDKHNSGQGLVLIETPRKSDKQNEMDSSVYKQTTTNQGNMN